jgi:hypothetical protein
VTGQRAIWFLKNGSLVSFIRLPTTPVAWHIAAMADFNGDGFSDLAWENKISGERGIWLLKDGSAFSVINLPTVPVAWRIAGAADFDGDGQADVVWENTVTGQRAIWLLKNGGFVSVIRLPTIPVAWHIVGASGSVAVIPTASPGVAFPLRVSTVGRYLVDQNNVPFMIVGDSPQALITKLSKAEAAAYFADRAALGFNAVWVNLLCNSYTGGNPDGSTFDGIVPFTTFGDLSTPNPAYFERVDDMIKLAAQYGLAIILDPIETGGWLPTLQSNGATKDFNYGAFLGNRYESFANIIWMHGNDFQNWSTGSDDGLVQAVANGIRSVDSNHIHTLELSFLVSSSLDDRNWEPIVSLNAAYTYFPTYAEVLYAYNQSSSVPVFMVEANYEFENNTGMDSGSASILRRQEYWTQLSGATGQLYGNHYTWQFAEGWQDSLDTTGAIQLGYMKNVFVSRAWYNLVPDQNHVVVTAGYGTFATTGSLGSNDYLTAARTPDGNLVMAYMPTARTITVDMSKLSGLVRAQWFDPTNNSYVSISSSLLTNSGFQQFTPPGNNGAGDDDWLLLLEVAQ